MKKCPFCAEEIQIEAIKCKHCGEMLNNEPKQTVRIDSRDIVESIKQAEAEISYYNAKVFLIGIVAIASGWWVGSVSGAKSGWILGITLFFGLSYYIVQDNKGKKIHTITRYDKIVTITFIVSFIVLLVGSFIWLKYF